MIAGSGRRLWGIVHDDCDSTREFPLSVLVVFIPFLTNNSRPLSARLSPTHSMKITRWSKNKLRKTVVLLSFWLHFFYFFYHYNENPFVSQDLQLLCSSRIATFLSVKNRRFFGYIRNASLLAQMLTDRSPNYKWTVSNFNENTHVLWNCTHDMFLHVALVSSTKKTHL